MSQPAPRAKLHACDFLAAKLAYKILRHALAVDNCGAEQSRWER